MRVGSLFTGIGGFDLGLERAGMQIGWQCEKNTYCQRILRQKWSHVRLFDDIRTIQDPPAVDLVCGGFPCQSVSIAGRRERTRDYRWLWPQFHRVIGMVRPTYVLVENVPGLLYGGFEEVVGSLAQLGYDAEWDCISASDFGAPHLRTRLWLVGYTQQESKRLQNRQKWAKNDPKWAKKRSQADFLVLDAPFAEMANSRRQMLQNQSNPGWSCQPDVDRVADGIPNRMDRLRALGNSLLPQIAEYLGRQILKAA